MELANGLFSIFNGGGTVHPAVARPLCSQPMKQVLVVLINGFFNGISRKPAHTVAQLASARQHHESPADPVKDANVLELGSVGRFRKFQQKK